MKSKIKSKLKRVVTGLLAMSMVVGLLPTNSITASAATTRTVSLTSYGRLGTVDVGSKVKSGTWWKMSLGSNTAFCMSLGKTCHSGNTYALDETHKWDQDTGGQKHGYYAKIIRWYVNDCKRSKKGFVMSQALMWAVAEGSNSESNLKNVIKQVKANTGYFDSKTVNALYRQIFEPEGLWTAQASYWTKTGASKSYQTLMTVDADETDLPKYKKISDSTYYRQRITIHKKDEDGKGLGGIKFTLSAHNLDDLYSFSVYDKDGNETTSADEDDENEFEVSGETTDGGTIAWRMTYKLFADECVYYDDDDLAKMSASEKSEAKEALVDAGYKQGVTFGKNMTKAEAKQLIKDELADQFDDVSNNYTLTEDSVGPNKNIYLDPVLKKGEKITLKKANSWKKNSDGEWPDMLAEHPTQYFKAYETSITNKYKKATIVVNKKNADSKDVKAHGDATLDGAEFQLYADKACATKATVYDAKGNSKTAGVYTISGGKLTTDYLRSGNTYYLKETKAPTGFLLNTEVKELKVDASEKTDEFTEVLMTADFPENEIHGKVAINKKSYDPTKKITEPEKNVTFQVYLKSKGSYDKCEDDERATMKTNDEGYAISTDLAYGTYIVHQVDSGDEDTYLIDDFEVQVTENMKTYTYDKINELFKAYLKIIKKDKNTEKTVLKAGTSYQIYKVVDDKEELVVQDYMDDGEIKQVDTFTCDESGEIQTVDSIKSGTYHLYETNAANGYHLNSDYIEITINSKADNYESYVDEEGYHHVTITVNFTNEETKGKLNIFKTGEVLTSWDAEKQNFVYEDVKLDGVEFTIYADGDIETQDNQSTDGVRDTWFKDGDTVCVITTGKGVEFNSECGGITGYTMDDDGTIHVSLPLGKYKVVETKTPYGYVYPEKKEWSVEFVWKDGQDEYVLNSTDATDENGTLNIKNAYAAPSVELLKQDADSKETIEGAVFGLYSKNDIFNIKGEKIVEAGALLATYTTDKDGKIYSNMKLPLMSEGYGADQKEEEKEPAKEENASGDAKEETPEQETPELSLVSLEDLLDNAPETLLENMEKAEEIKLENALNSGDYFLKELSVSDSYYLDETPIDIHLEYKDAETKTLPVSKVADNTQTTNEVDKMDVAGSKEIDGCKLVIVDARGIEIVKWTSGDKDSIKIKVGDKEGYRNLKATMDDKGNLHIGGLFHDQDYTLIERRPADGYVTANDITYQIKNVAMSAALPAPAPAEPVSGDAVSVEAPAPQEIVTTGVAISSIVTIKNEDGTYTDQLDDKTIMHDEETHIQLLKLDAKTGQALGGAKFTVTDSKGNEVMKFVTKDDDFDITGKLVVGETYTFTETSAPSGFLLAKPVKLKIKDTAEVQKVVVKDQPIPDTPDTPQTGKTAPVIPITLCLIAAIGGAILIFKKKK